jgi:serine/threonine protein kinase
MAEPALAVGATLDARFTLDKKLGQGAFGEVWAARDLARDGAPAAVKILFEKYHRDRKMMQRFLQEASLMERLTHPNIARAYHFQGEGAVVYLAMELIEGDSLDRRCEAHGAEGSFIPKPGVAWMCDQLAAAVDYAHQQGVIHRDLKPRNIMVNRRGERPFLKVLDFGIAKVLVGGQVDPTTVGRVLGSVLYLAPEQILSQGLDHRADLFSLATILFEIITLHRAWARTPEGTPHPSHLPISVGEHNSHVAVLRRIARDARPSACALRADLSPAVDQVLGRALAVDPDARYPDASSLARALRLALLDEGGATAVPPAATTVPDQPPPSQDSLPRLGVADAITALESPPAPQGMESTRTLDEAPTRPPPRGGPPAVVPAADVAVPPAAPALPLPPRARGLPRAVPWLLLAAAVAVAASAYLTLGAR